MGFELFLKGAREIKIEAYYVINYIIIIVNPSHPVHFASVRASRKSSFLGLLVETPFTHLLNASEICLSSLKRKNGRKLMRIARIKECCLTVWCYHVWGCLLRAPDSILWDSTWDPLYQTALFHFSPPNRLWNSIPSLLTNRHSLTYIKPLKSTPRHYTTSSSTPPIPQPKPTLKTLIKQYGPAAYITFEAISNLNFFTWFLAIHLGIDVQPVIDYATDIKNQYFGSSVDHTEHNDAEVVVAAVTEGANVDVSHPAHHPKAGTYARLGTEFILAHAINGLFLPLRIGLTVYLTPRVAQRLVASAWDAWLRRQIGRIPWIGRKLS